MYLLLCVMYFLFSLQSVDCFHVYNLVYNSYEFILVMLRLLFQTFINCSSKFAWNSSHRCSTRWDVLSLVLQLPTKNLLIGRSAATLPLFETLRLPFLLQVVTTQVLDSIANGSRPDNSTLHLTFIHFVPFKILAP